MTFNSVDAYALRSPKEAQSLRDATGATSVRRLPLPLVKADPAARSNENLQPRGVFALTLTPPVRTKEHVPTRHRSGRLAAWTPKREANHHGQQR